MIVTEPKVIVPNQKLARVYHHLDKGVHAYDEDDLYTPDSSLWRSKVLDLRLYEYPPNNTYAFDRSRYNNHGTVTGATWGIQGRTFPGSGPNIISVPDTTLLRVTDFTLLAWIYPTQTAYQEIIGKGNTESGNYGFEWGLTNTNTFRTFIGDGVAQSAWNGTGTIPTTWFLAGSSWNDTTQICTHYVNGAVLDASSALPRHIAHTTDALSIGFVGNRYKGIIGEALIYNRALSAQERQQIYLSTKWRYT